MPYSSTSDLPAQAKNLSPKQKRAFLQAFNSAHKAGKSEKSAFRIAWAAAKKSDGEVGKNLVFLGEIDRGNPVVSPRDQKSVEAMYRLGNLPAHYAKHLKGQHDQSLHGSREKQYKDAARKTLAIASFVPWIGGAASIGATALSGTRQLTKKKEQEIIAEVQGSSLEESMQNAKNWMLDRQKSGDKIEFGFAMRDNGEVISMNLGTEYAAAIAGSKDSLLQRLDIAADSMKGIHLTHLHPYQHSDKASLAPLSDADVSIAVEGEMGSMRSVTQEGESRLSFDWPDDKKERKKMKKRLRKELTSPYSSALSDEMSKEMIGEVPEDAGIMETLKRTWDGSREFKKKPIHEQRQLAENASKKVNQRLQEITEDLDGVSYHTTLWEKASKRAEGLDSEAILTLGGHLIREQPTISMIYGVYGFAKVLDEVDPEIESPEEFDDALDEISQGTGIRDSQIVEDFGKWLIEKGIEQPSSNHFEKFIVASYQDREPTSKHLVGRHNQDSHGRKEHKALQRRMQRGSKKAKRRYNPHGGWNTLADVMAVSAVAAGAMHFGMGAAFRAPQYAKSVGRWRRGLRDFPLPFSQREVARVQRTGVRARQATERGVSRARQSAVDSFDGVVSTIHQKMRAGTKVVDDIPDSAFYAGGDRSPFLPVPAS